MDIDTLHGLKACQLFSGLGESEIIGLVHTIRYRVVRYHKGDIFTMVGDTCLHADIVVSGEMAATLVAPTGRTVRMTMHHSGNMLAPAFLFANDNHYPVTVEAVADTEVFRLQAADLEALLRQDRRVMMNFIRILSNIIAYLTKKVGVLSMTVREKVTHYLKEQQREQQSDRIRLTLSRQQLADLFGIQKYSLQRCLGEMQAEGLIRLEGKVIQIIRWR